MEAAESVREIFLGVNDNPLPAFLTNNIPGLSQTVSRIDNLFPIYTNTGYLILTSIN